MHMYLNWAGAWLVEKDDDDDSSQPSSGADDGHDESRDLGGQRGVLGALSKVNFPGMFLFSF